MTKDVWFITGASTGLGKSLVQFLLTQKCKVVATARNPEDIKKYTQQYTNHDDLMILETRPRFTYRLRATEIAH